MRLCERVFSCNFYYFGENSFWYNELFKYSVSFCFEMLIALDLCEANGSNDNNNDTCTVESHTHFKSNKISFQAVRVRPHQAFTLETLFKR